jgi:hypothetical protein
LATPIIPTSGFTSAPVVMAERPAIDPQAGNVIPGERRVVSPAWQAQPQRHDAAPSSPAEGWDMARSGFASHEYEGAGTAQVQRTLFASSKVQQEASTLPNEVVEPSEFAAGGQAPARNDVGPFGRPATQPVAALAPAASDTNQRVPITPKPASAAVRSLRSPAVHVKPMTANGQWPTAFVGSESLKAPTEPTKSGVNLSEAAAVVSGQTGVVVLRSPTWRAQLPSPVLLAQLKEQIQTVGGPAVRNVALRYQDDMTVILAITLTDASGEQTIADKVAHLDGLAASGVGVEIIGTKADTTPNAMSWGQDRPGWH